jgi:predicted site-specific integrase-resolvase
MPVVQPRPRYGEYLKLSEAARLTGIPTRTLVKWCHAGLVPGAVVTPTNQYLVPESAVGQLLRPAAKVTEPVK